MQKDCYTVVRFNLHWSFSCLSSSCADWGKGDGGTDSQMGFCQVGVTGDKGTRKFNILENICQSDRLLRLSWTVMETGGAD